MAMTLFKDSKGSSMGDWKDACTRLKNKMHRLSKVGMGLRMEVQCVSIQYIVCSMVH